MLYTITVKANSDFSQSIEDLAFALQAQQLSESKLKLNEELVPYSQLAFVLPIYGYELQPNEEGVAVAGVVVSGVDFLSRGIIVSGIEYPFDPSNYEYADDSYFDVYYQD